MLRRKTMSDTAANQRQPRAVVHDGRDWLWAQLHQPDSPAPVRHARKKWQCLACGECGFVEMDEGEDPLLVARRIGHHCQPESIAFYHPGAHQALTD
jgi:hypothetical protein